MLILVKPDKFGKTVKVGEVYTFGHVLGKLRHKWWLVQILQSDKAKEATHRYWSCNLYLLWPPRCVTPLVKRRGTLHPNYFSHIGLQYTIGLYMQRSYMMTYWRNVFPSGDFRKGSIATPLCFHKGNTLWFVLSSGRRLVEPDWFQPLNIGILLRSSFFGRIKDVLDNPEQPIVATRPSQYLLPNHGKNWRSRTICTCMNYGNRALRMQKK